VNGKQLTKTILLLLLLIYWAVSLRHLTVVPTVYEDEPWIASTGWKLAATGTFGSDLFAGFYGMENANYGFLPVYSFIAAAVFKLIGLGIFQVRLESVIFGLLVLALTYALGRRLFRPSVGLLALFLLLFTPTTGLTPSQYTGILLVDIARIARYDIAVPAFGLAALLLYTTITNHQPPITNHQSPNFPYILRFTLYVLLGLLTALSSLSHLYGLFWLAALLLLFIWHKTGWRNAAAFIIGFSLPWAAYIAFVLANYADWQGQTQIFPPRFELFDPAWYWQNITTEFRRYGPGLGEGSPFRPGLVTAALVVPLSLFALGRQAWHGDKKAQTLLVPLIILPTLFAVLLYVKLSNYLIAIAPLFTLLIAWGLLKFHKFVGQTDSLPIRKHLIYPLHLVIPLVLLLITLEGTTRLNHLEQTAVTTTPYPEFTAEIQSHLPPDGTILALHHYWLNFQNWDYHTWYVPLLQSNPDFWQPPQSMESALTNIDPDIILIDPRLRDLFNAEPETAEAAHAWMTAHGFQQTAVVEDTTYGRMEIYLKSPR
jgi:4-amino-4-deoxy-L-arabinose transferase-like glycosyltransferase